MLTPPHGTGAEGTGAAPSQATLGGIKIESFPLQQEAQHALPVAQRVVKCRRLRPA